MKDIIDYYEDGGPSTGTAEQKKAHKDWAEDWMKKLNAEFYDNANPLGRQGMYLVLKRKFRGDNEYPTKRFVGAWLRRQISNQVNRVAPKKAPSIQSIIVNKPNDLIQVDYMYFFRHITGAPLIDGDEEMTDAQRKKLEGKLSKKKIHWQGCITAIDCFSRVGYARAIKGTLNSKKAFAAMQSIIAEAKKRYGTDIKKVQTDKGSEFMLDFRKGLKGLAADNEGFYKHVFGYSGRSQAQGVVERFNGTLKRLLFRHLNFKLGRDWKDHLDKAVENYNSNPHRVIRMAPDDVKPANYKDVKRNILDRAKKSKRFQGVVYKPGDFVRLKIYKPKRLKPSYTYKDGPLYDLKPERIYQGVYMVSRVNRPEGTNKISAAPTYTIIAKWSKETTPDWYAANEEEGGTLPSGVKIRDEVIDIPGSVFDGETFARGSYGRKFVKDELVRVPMDKEGKPIVEGKLTGKEDSDEETDEEVEAPAPAPVKQPKTYTPPDIKGKEIKVKFYWVASSKEWFVVDKASIKRRKGKQSGEFFGGKVKSYDKETKEHTLVFDDGAEMVLNFTDSSESDYISKQNWKLA
jgi:hypothetical protein